MSEDWFGWLVTFLILAIPGGLLFSAIYRNSVGLGALAFLAFAVLASVGIWFLSLFNTDL